MDGADPAIADLVAGKHRQRGELLDNGGVPQSRRLEAGVDAIRTFDDGRIDVIRIGTAATRHGTSDAEFGFDVAEDGVLRLDGLR
jgi:hypothetical protein